MRLMVLDIRQRWRSPGLAGRQSMIDGRPWKMPTSHVQAIVFGIGFLYRFLGLVQHLSKIVFLFNDR